MAALRTYATPINRAGRHTTLPDATEAVGYSSSSYGIGGRAKYRDHAIIVDRWSNRWVVYYTERGTKTDIRKARVGGRGVP